MKREIQFEDFRLAFIRLWNYKLVIFFVTLAGLFTGLLVTSDESGRQLYNAKSSVYCAIYGSANATNTTNTRTNTISVQTMLNYSDVVSSRKISEYAASLIKDTYISAEEIQNMIYITSSDKSYVININARSIDAGLSIKVANAVAEAFSSEMVNITGSDSVQVLDVASGAKVVKNNDMNVKRLMFSLGAFLLVASLIIIKSLLSDKVRSIMQCIDNEDEILGIIPEIE